MYMRHVRMLMFAIICGIGVLLVVEANGRPPTVPDGDGSLNDLRTVEREAHQLFHKYDGAPPRANLIALSAKMQKAFDADKPMMDASVIKFVRTCYKISTHLTTTDMGIGEKRFVLCQRLIAGCLPYASVVPISLEMKIVSQMSPNLDLEGNRLTEGTRPAYRREYAQKKLQVWKKLEAAIDPTWAPNDPANLVYMSIAPKGGNYLPGTPPERIVEPEIRKDYQQRIAENFRRSEKNLEQTTARRNKKYWLKRALRRDMIWMYEGFVGKGDMEVLEALLRIYVSDKKLRKELFDAAQAASKRTSGSKTRPSDSESK